MEFLGIDIGGSGIKGAPVNVKTGELTGERFRLETPQPATPEAVAETLRKVVRHFKWSGPIGCGFPAVIQNGCARTASNIPAKWIGTNVAQLFSEAVGCAIYVLNDADAAGLAEMRFGAGREQKGVTLLITIGTGLGSATFTGGNLLYNTEFGHVLLNGDIAERYASDAVRKKEDLSWKKWGKRFNEYLQLMEKLLWPDLIILGGGASKKFSKYSEYLELNARVQPAELRNQAGIIGAALFAHAHHPA